VKPIHAALAANVLFDLRVESALGKTLPRLTGSIDRHAGLAARRHLDELSQRHDRENKERSLSGRETCYNGFPAQSVAHFDAVGPISKRRVPPP
jgi:hypothetical protein